ncbi:MAG: phospholipase D-like domain-containing protein, partial [Dokdonella sp.]
MRAATTRHHPPRDVDYSRQVAQHAFSRTAGAPLIAGNQVDLLIDARANYDAWLEAIRAAKHSILFENYIIRADDTGREFLNALAERASAGVRVLVMRDWIGCIGQSRASFWQPLLDAGGEVRAFQPFRITRPFEAIHRNHRKSLIVDADVGFISGLCLSSVWLGDAERGIEPWRDTGVAIRGPSIAALIEAFDDNWRYLGDPLDETIRSRADSLPDVGDVDLRVVASRPNEVALYRLDQLVAALAQRSLWLSDAYFVGTAAYVQALRAAARDGVDVRLLVPGSSDIPAVGSMSRAGYRPLLEAGVRGFEWNGSMMHAKTAVADGRWARVGSTNLNIASWLGNSEIDVAIENAAFAAKMEQQYEVDLGNATEIVLTQRHRAARSEEKSQQASASGKNGRRTPRRGNGSTGRVAA